MLHTSFSELDKEALNNNIQFTNRPGKIATVPVGYGYGLSRTLSNNGYVPVGGNRSR